MTKKIELKLKITRDIYIKIIVTFQGFSPYKPTKCSHKLQNSFEASGKTLSSNSYKIKIWPSLSLSLFFFDSEKETLSYLKSYVKATIAFYYLKKRSQKK